MPELPEVETLRRDLIRDGLIGARILSVEVLWERTVQVPGEAVFRRRIAGAIITDIERRGKYLIFRLDGPDTLLCHLRMTGAFEFHTETRPPGAHDRVLFALDRGALVFRDTRKFGRMTLTADPDALLSRLGPEPFDPSLDADFHRRLTARRRRLKPLLLDQECIAGLGNIYVDESLFGARLHPELLGSALTRAQSGRLLAAIREALEQGIANRGTSLGDGKTNFSSGGLYGRNAAELRVFRRTGSPCFRCGTPIERIVVAQRSTHFCPRCQPAPREDAVPSREM